MQMRRQFIRCSSQGRQPHLQALAKPHWQELLDRFDGMICYDVTCHDSILGQGMELVSRSTMHLIRCSWLGELRRCSLQSPAGQVLVTRASLLAHVPTKPAVPAALSPTSINSGLLHTSPAPVLLYE